MNQAHATSPRHRASGLRPAAILLLALFSLGPAPSARTERPAPTPTSWQDARKVTPEALAKALPAAGAETPAMIHVGPRVLLAEAHSPGSQYAGPGSNAAGIDAHRKAVAALPTTTPIFLQGGCCPWERCPNMELVWRVLAAERLRRGGALLAAAAHGGARPGRLARPRLWHARARRPTARPRRPARKGRRRRLPGHLVRALPLRGPAVGRAPGDVPAGRPRGDGRLARRVTTLTTSGRTMAP
jgi:hypothetical protein